MNLTERQQEIVTMVKQTEPISAEQIAKNLDLSKSTIRSDLAVLCMTGLLEARPKVGYIYSGLAFTPLIEKRLYQVPVRDVMRPPLMVSQQTLLQDAITDMFMYDSGSLFITDEDEQLVGVVSRKDIVRFLLMSGGDNQTPIGIVMTRMPNVVVVNPDTPLYEAAKLLQLHEIDSLPVVDATNPLTVIGKLSKTTILNHYIQQRDGGAE